MPPTPDDPAARLGEALGGLRVVVEEVACNAAGIEVPSYAGRRPTSRVTLRGRRSAGHGENVAWTEAAHARFARHVRAVPRGSWRLGEWAAAMRQAVTDPYERAALEAAAVDLVLRQHHTQLFGLAGVAGSAVRYVVSFGRIPEIGRAHV